MHEILLLNLIIPGRILFLEPERYGHFHERRYHRKYGHTSDWLSFHTTLDKSQPETRLAIAFAPNQARATPIQLISSQSVQQHRKRGWKHPGMA